MMREIIAKCEGNALGGTLAAFGMDKRENAYQLVCRPLPSSIQKGPCEREIEFSKAFKKTV